MLFGLSYTRKQHFKSLKTDSRVKIFRISIDDLFRLDGWKHSLLEAMTQTCAHQC